MHHPMVRRLRTVSVAGGIAVLTPLAFPAQTLAHTGEDVPLSHVILEVGQWSLGTAAVLGALLGILWLRARMRGRGE